MTTTNKSANKKLFKRPERAIEERVFLIFDNKFSAHVKKFVADITSTLCATFDETELALVKSNADDQKDFMMGEFNLVGSAATRLHVDHLNLLFANPNDDRLKDTHNKPPSHPHQRH